MDRQNDIFIGMAFMMIAFIFLMSCLLTYDHFQSQLRPDPVMEPICDDQYQVYVFLYRKTPTVRMTRYQQRQWCPPTPTATYYYRSPTPDWTATPACIYNHGGC